MIGVETDVDSWRTVLYCPSTERPPFQASTPMETIRFVIDEEPVSLKTLNPAVDVDLKTICLKCLSVSIAGPIIATYQHKLEFFWNLMSGQGGGWE
jgi:hypothetical protein